MHDIKELEGLEIFLGYACNVTCNFCYQKELRKQHPKNFTKSHVLNLIQKGYETGKKFIIFSGGEATLDKNLGEYIKFSKELGFQHIRVHTNGFRFQNYEYLKDLCDRGLTGVTISIHGYQGIHDIITKTKGSFGIILKALINFQKYKISNPEFIFDINTVICKQNYKNLPQLIMFLSKFSFTRGQIVLAYSLDLFNYSEKQDIVPEYNLFLPYIHKSLELAHKYNKKIVLENIPFCLLKKDYWQDVTENIKVSKESFTILDTQESNLDNKWMHKSKVCKECSLHQKCRGIPEDYYELYGDLFLKPI